MPVMVDPKTGEVFDAVPDAEVQRATDQFGLITPEHYATLQKYGGAIDQAKSAGKLAARTATFGAAFDAPEDKEQIKTFSELSPTLSALTQVAGAAAPAALAGVGAGAVMGTLGLSSRAAAIGAAVAEEAAGNTAFEVEDAIQQDRGIDVGNIILGTGLGAGISSAARMAHGGLSALKARASSGTLAAAEEGSNWLARGKKVSGERRSVGAAGAEDARRPASPREVEAYAERPEEYHEQVNQAGHDALADAFTGHEAVTGSTSGAARQVHGLSFKEQDVIPHMLDVDPDIATEAVYEHAEAAMKVAEAVKSRSPATARRIQAAAEAALQGLDGADATMVAAKGAVGLNRLKQELDDITGNFLKMKGTEAKSAGKEVQKAANALRANLEDGGTWGDFWAERQTGENALWSGDNGIIQLSNVWQPEVFQSVKGKAWVKIDDQLSEVMNRTPRPDIAQHIMSMKPIQARKVLDAWESTIDQWERMTALKEESGLVRNALSTTGESPVDLLKRSLAEQRQVVEELRHLRDVGPRAKPILDKLAAKGPAKAQGELLFDAAESIPVVGRAVKAADVGTEVATGKSIRDRLFKAEALPPAREFDRAASLEAIRARQAERAGSAARPPSTPQGGPPVPPAAPRSPAPSAAPAPLSKTTVAAGVGAVGVLAAGTAGATESLAEISGNAKAIQERAALGMMVKDSRPPRLPGIAERFKDKSPDLQSAFRLRAQELREITDDPEAFVQGMVHAFGTIGEDHPRLFQQVVTRTQIGAQYLLANVPPSVGISMARPDGIQPDMLAVMKFAAMYDAVFHPGNVVYDVGTGDATPTQIRALREVHPDIYGELRANVLKQIGQAGQNVPFETLRQLDNLFDMPGVAGPAFSPAMTQTMAAAYQQTASKSPKQSLSGESVIAPDSATSKLAGLAAVR